jgi:hypothetical protein
MVTYSCDRCNVVVSGPDGLKSGTFVNASGSVSSPIVGAICEDCLKAVQDFVSTPIIPDVGLTVMEKTIVQAQVQVAPVLTAATGT